MNIQPVGGHRRIVVMGLGLFGGGVGAARFWSELGSKVTVTDLRDAETLAPSLKELEGTGCRFVLGEHRDEDFKQADLVVVNPAVKPDNKYLRLARAAGAEMITEVGLVMRLVKGPVIGVTGSNGKSTTTGLIGAMLRHFCPDVLVGGNIGGSLLPKLKNHLPSNPIVLELSSFQLHYLKMQQVSPAIAVVTNLSPNHLDWHRSELSYYEDKRNILQFQGKKDTAVLNADDGVLREWVDSCKGRVILTSLTDPGTDNAAFIRTGDSGEVIVVRLSGKEQEVAPASHLRLPGEHNRVNAVQAAAAAFAQCKSAMSVAVGLESFDGLPHRLEEVARQNGKRFINDSISTTPESAICALKAYDEPKVLIAGGYDKGMPFDELAREIVTRASSVVLVGAASGKIKTAIEKAISELEQAGPVDAPLVADAGSDFDSAVKVAAGICPDNGVVLLSPACASYDMFTNFEQRGEVFAKLARRIAAE